MPKLVSTAQITITDQNDYIFTGTTPPRNPIANLTLWIDISTTPAQQKRWTGSTWEIVNEVQVGGRNLILDTKSSNTQVTIPNGVGYRFFFGLTPISNFGLKAGDSVVLAFNLDGVPVGYYCAASFAVEVNGSVIYVNGAVSYQSGQRAFCMYKLPVGTTQIAPYIALNTAAAGSISFNYNSLKLEKGNKATDWSPAPEDVQAEIDNIQVGGRNLILDSNQYVETNNYYLKSAYSSVALITGETYTLTISGDVGRIYDIWCNWGNTPIGKTIIKSSGISSLTFKMPTLNSGLENLINIYRETVPDTSLAKIIWVKLEKGNRSTDWTPAPEDVDAKIDNLKPAGKNYLIGSRTDNVTGWFLSGGTATVVTDAQYGKVVEYSRPAGGGDFMKVFSIDTSELKNTELVYYCIAKPISGTTIFNFGGWNETFTMLNNNSPYRDIGSGWRMYYKVFTAGSAIASGVTFGLNSVGGTWRFHSFGVAKGNTPPSDWDASPKEIDFLKQGYKASTDIEGGVVQTAVLLLRNALEQVTAGISGLGGDNVINWGAGTYQDAINDAAKTFGAAMVTSFLNKDDGGGHLAFGKIAWNNAGLLKVIGNIEALSGKIGNFKISDGAIVGYDTNGVARLKVSPINVPALSSIISTSWVDLNASNLDNSVNGDVYSDSEYIETFVREIVTTHDFTIPIAAKVTTETNAQYQAHGYEYIDSFYTTVKYYQGQTLISTQSGYSTLPAGTYRVEVRSVLTFTVQGHSSAAYDIGHTDSRIRYEGAIKQTEFGLNGMYSVFSPTEYLHFREGSGLSVRGATDIPAGLGGASINSGGGISNRWGLAGTIASRSSNTTTVKHNVTDTKFTVDLTPRSSFTWYLSSITAASSPTANNGNIVIVCSSTTAVFDFTIKRTPY